jgi:hypothetical protein
MKGGQSMNLVYAVLAVGLAVIVWRHRPGKPVPYLAPATKPKVPAPLMDEDVAADGWPLDAESVQVPAPVLWLTPELWLPDDGDWHRPHDGKGTYNCPDDLPPGPESQPPSVPPRPGTDETPPAPQPPAPEPAEAEEWSPKWQVILAEAERKFMAEILAPDFKLPELPPDESGWPF